jgi:hypothetical protein
MPDIYMYADETGNLDYNLGQGSSKYFGIGTATWRAGHGAHLWEATALRFRHAAAGVACPAGYHAKNDSHATRAEVYDLIGHQSPRFDTTFLAKANAYSHVRARGETYLYRLAWFLHFKEIARQVAGPGDTLHVAVATLGTKARKRAFQDAISEVCRDHAPGGRTVVVAHWDSASSWGLQVADYALWAVQRQLERGDASYMTAVAPTLRSQFLPWGQA